MHTEAERSGIMRSLLRGELGRAPYCLLLRNLHAIYAPLEQALAVHAHHTLLAPIHNPQLYRLAAIEADLDLLHGAGWTADLQVVQSSGEYAARLEQCTASSPELLLAHAYVRYLGDLSGGQILCGIVQKSMQLSGDDGTHFYRFGTADAKTLAARFRAGLDAAEMSDEIASRIVSEARSAFSMHTRMFEELARS